MAPSTTKAAEGSAESGVTNDEFDEDDQLVVLRRPRPVRRYKSMKVIMRKAIKVEFLIVDDDDHDDSDETMKNDGGDGKEGKSNEYRELDCEKCGLGDKETQILICDKCDKGFHMKCLRPVAVRIPEGEWSCPNCYIPPKPETKTLTQTTILDFFRIEKCTESTENLASALDVRKRRRRSSCLVFHKKRRRLLPFVPVKDGGRRMQQLASLASVLISMNIKFSPELTYMPGMAPRWANKAKFENGGMQVLSKEDLETVKYCEAMGKKGLCPPLMVVYDSYEGYTVEADGPIKDMTFIAEYAGDVDYMKKREHDDCDSLMTLLSAKKTSKSLVICPDKRGNIARFINGINNHLPKSRKKQNLKCIRYDINGECRVLLVATRDIAKGERLYYDYNGHEYEYPTQHFI